MKYKGEMGLVEKKTNLVVWKISEMSYQEQF